MADADQTVVVEGESYTSDHLYYIREAGPHGKVNRSYRACGIHIIKQLGERGVLGRNGGLTPKGRRVLEAVREKNDG